MLSQILYKTKNLEKIIEMMLIHNEYKKENS